MAGIFIRRFMQTNKKLLSLVGFIIAIFVLANFHFFSANLKFMFLSRKLTVFRNTSENAYSSNQILPDYLIIKSLGISAPVIYISEKNEKTYQTALASGVVHYPGTANPGELGNCYIFGHSSDYLWSKGKYKSVFAILPSIKLGDIITVSNIQGQVFEYVVTGSRKVAANDLSVLDQQGNKKKLLTLQTSYPIGTALARWIVVAELKD